MQLFLIFLQKLYISLNILIKDLNKTIIYQKYSIIINGEIKKIKIMILKTFFLDIVKKNLIKKKEFIINIKLIKKRV